MFKIFSIIPKHQYPMCCFIMIAMIIGAVLEAIGIGAILPLISIIGDQYFLTKHPNIAEMIYKFGIIDHKTFIIILSLFLMMVYWVKNAYIAWECKLQISFSVRNMVCYSREILSAYLEKPYLFHINNNTATLIRDVNSGAVSAFGMILIPTFQLFTELVTATTIWGMLIFVDPFTALIIAGLLGGLLILILIMFRRIVTTQGHIQNECSAQYIKWVNQSLGAIKETKILHKENYFLHEFDSAYKKFAIANGHFNFLNQLPRMIIETIVVSGLLLLISVKVLLGESTETIVPLLGVLALAAFRLMPSVNRIINFYNQIKFQQPLFNHLYDEFHSIRRKLEDSNLKEPNQIITKMNFNDKIIVRDLIFGYPDSEKMILKGINCEIPKGSFVGIVGSSGAGKTTFVDILLGLLEPDKGGIYIDGNDMRSNTLGWQMNLAYVPQTIYLIDGNIKENIALGMRKDDIDEDQMKNAIEMADLTDYIDSLPLGMNTKVGERGVKLSGGQRQRIGIARALYQKPEVLVLDEATSALDTATEQNITNTILKIKGKITIIAIAHRVSTLKECDFKVEFIDGLAKQIPNT